MALHRLRPWFFIMIFFSMTLTSCSAIQGVLVDNLDFFVKREVNAALDLNSEQEKKWDKKWSKNLTELAKAGFFRAIADDIDVFSKGWQKGSLTYAGLEVLINKIRNVWEYPGGGFLRRQTALLVLDLNELNFKALKGYLAEKTEERFEAKKLKQAEFVEARGEKALDSFEDWYGEPTKEQSTKILAWVDLPVESYRKRYLQRVQAEKSVLAHLTSYSKLEQVENALSYWLKAPQSLRTGELKDVYIDYQKEWKRRIIKIDQLVSKAQRRQAIEKLREAISLLNEIDRRWRQ